MYHVKNLYVIAILLLVVMSCKERVKQGVAESKVKYRHSFRTVNAKVRLTYDTGNRYLSSDPYRFLYTDSSATTDSVGLIKRVEFVDAEVKYREKLTEECSCHVFSKGGFFKGKRLEYYLSILADSPEDMLKKKHVLNDLKKKLFVLLPGISVSGWLTYFKKDSAGHSPYFTIPIEVHM